MQLALPATPGVVACNDNLRVPRLGKSVECLSLMERQPVCTNGQNSRCNPRSDSLRDYRSAFLMTHSGLYQFHLSPEKPSLVTRTPTLGKQNFPSQGLERFGTRQASLPNGQAIGWTSSSEGPSATLD